MRKLLLPMALLATLAGMPVGTPAVAADLPTPLGLYGFDLGMTLAEVRQLGHPDKPAGKVELVCTGDKLSDEADVRYPAGSTNHEIGLKMCSYIAVAAGRVRGVPMNVGGHDAEVRFLITPKSADPAVSERLYYILVATQYAHFRDLLAAYTAKFGKPSRPSSWEDSRAALTFFEIPPALHISYTDKELDRLVDALKSKTRKLGADKL